MGETESFLLTFQHRDCLPFSDPHLVKAFFCSLIASRKRIPAYIGMDEKGAVWKGLGT